MSKTKLPIIYTRPEFSGRNHPTYVAAFDRERGTAYHSESAIKALESFEAKTGIKTTIRRGPFKPAAIRRAGTAHRAMYVKKERTTDKHPE